MAEAINIEFSGVHHMALVCKDMEKTVDFYTRILGMKLVKAFDLGAGMGQHFFFDMGGDNLLAFFWFDGAPVAAPGIASAENLLGTGGINSAHGSMNHVAFHASLEKIEGFREQLINSGVECSVMINHADVETVPGETNITGEPDETTWVRSFYFLDPDGIMLEFCAPVTPGTDELTLPVNADGVKADGSTLVR